MGLFISEQHVPLDIKVCLLQFDVDYLYIVHLLALVRSGWLRVLAEFQWLEEIRLLGVGLVQMIFI